MRPLTKKSKAIRDFLNNEESDPLVCSYLLQALTMPPLAGEWFLLKEMKQGNKEIVLIVKKALDMLIDNNREIYEYTNMINNTTGNT